MNKDQISVLRYLDLPVTEEEPKEKIVVRPVERTSEGKTVVEYHRLSSVTNEELVKYVHLHDEALADEIQARFKYYFEELDWLFDELDGKKYE
jgi:hypothetical protein